MLAQEYHGERTVFDTPQTPQPSYPYGTTLTLKVIPSYGFVFNRWSIDGNILSTETTYDYYLSANKELKLFFDRDAFNLTVSNIVNNDEDDLTAGGTVKGGGSGYYEYGEEVTLTAEPDRCYRFVGWFTDEEAGEGKPKGLRRAASLDGLTLLTTASTYVYTVGGEMKLYPVFHRMGDVNGDNRFTIADVVLEANYIKDGSAGNFAQDEADANGDGQITISDVVEIANSVKSK